jgi:hypothetical protein
LKKEGNQALTRSMQLTNDYFNIKGLNSDWVLMWIKEWSLKNLPKQHGVPAGKLPVILGSEWRVHEVMITSLFYLKVAIPGLSKFCSRAYTHPPMILALHVSWYGRSWKKDPASTYVYRDTWIYSQLNVNAFYRLNYSAKDFYQIPYSNILYI